MFVGHGMLAFAIGASLALVCGWSRKRVWAVAIVAALFATLPDVDMLYAVVGILGGMEGVFVTSDTFWDVANEVHRGATHSLVVGAVAAIGFGAWRVRGAGWARVLSVLTLSGLVATVWAVSGVVVATIVAVFVLCGLGVVALADRLGLGPWTVFGAALLGLLTHPFGDVFAGPSPGLLYPIDLTLVSEQVVLHPDPTLHLLGAFGLELATVWAVFLIVTQLRSVRVRDHVSSRAVLGLGYAAAVFAIPAPTIEVASPFVFSVLAVGLVGVPFDRARNTDSDTESQVLTAVTTGLAAVTLAAFAYAVAYLVVLA